MSSFPYARPKTPLGRVLVEYRLQNTGSEKAWSELKSSSAFQDTKKLIADLTRWGVPDAKKLQADFDKMQKEGESKFVADYERVLSNFKQIQKDAATAHREWKDQGAEKDFIDVEWEKIRVDYLK